MTEEMVGKEGKEENDRNWARLLTVTKQSVLAPDESWFTRPNFGLDACILSGLVRIGSGFGAERLIVKYYGVILML